MTFVVFFLVKAVTFLLSALEILMLIRAILSWIPVDEDSALERFVYAVTEPVILPVRSLLERSERIASLPIDLSFLITYFLLIIVQFLLPKVSL